MEFIKKTFYGKKIGDCICAIDHEGMSNQDWREWIDFVVEQMSPFGEIKVLVYSKGGKPSTEQRASFEALCEKKPVSVAVLTDVLLVRGAVMAFGWAGKIRIKAFAPKNIPAAAEFLKVDPSHLDQIHHCISTMNAVLGAGW